MENTSTPSAATRPALSSPASLARATRDLLAWHKKTGKMPVGQLIWVMRQAGRATLIHYAGACHRDSVAWHFCAAYLADPSASEAVLKSRALKAAWGVDVAPEQIESVGGGRS